ncbi:hypothetical protein [Hymenobacter ruber]
MNLVSKTPTLGTPQYAASYNQTTLRETDLNGFVARRGQRWCYSAFVGLVNQKEKDVDGDGFVDVPRVRSLNLHPRLFFYPNAHSQEALGYTGTLESRRAGDLEVLKKGFDPVSGHVFYVDNTSLRNTADLLYTSDELADGRLTVKGTITDFVRDVNTNSDAFTAYQTTYYTEASYLHAAGLRRKFAAVGLVEFTDNFSAGLEASYIGQQYRSDGSATPGYPLFAALLRYRLDNFTLALNGENVLDYRQTRREKAVLSPLDNPVFRELWAPVEGGVFNVSLTWRWAKT